MSYYLGEKKDKFCPHCGNLLQIVKYFTGRFDTQTGKKEIVKLKVCENKQCDFHVPQDLMQVVK